MNAEIPAAPEPTSPTVLVVDDMPIIRDPIAANLRAAGYHTLCASNGSEALQVIRASRRVDLILLDVLMPGMGGLTFLQHLRMDLKHAPTPVILLSAAEGKSDILAAARYGVCGYLLKSKFSLKELLLRVKAQLEHVPVNDAVAASPTVVAATAPTTEVSATASVTAPGPASAAVSAVAIAEVPQLLTREESTERAETAMQSKTLSGVVAQVISSAASPRGDTDQLASLVSRDPLLAARVLRAANSAGYASNRGPVSNIPDAIRQIGCSAVRDIATTLGVFDAMPESGSDGSNPIRCWQHSFAVARLCEQLAPGGDGMAYLVGLCHDLGEILLQTRFGPEYRQVLEACARTGRPREELERVMLGLSRNELAATVLRCVGLPDAIRGPIEAYHRGGSPSASDPPLTRVLRLADLYANGVLLAQSDHAPLAPLTRAECRAATGTEGPPCPDGAQLRGDVLALTAMLARLSAADEAKLMEPLYPRSASTRVWLARHPGLSSFDPIAAALGSLAEVTVASALPQPGELGEHVGVVAVAPASSTGGFTAQDLAAVSSKARAGKPTPLLWLVGRIDVTPATSAGGAVPKPVACPVSLGDVAEFIRTLG